MTVGVVTSRSSLRQWTALGVALGMVACFMVLFYVPNAGQAKAAARKLAEARAARTIKWHQSQGLPGLDEEVATMMTDHQRNLSRIPREGEMPEFLKKVSDFLRAAGIQMREVIPEGPQAKEDYVEQSMVLTFETSFRAGYGILDRLENMDRITRVDRLEMVSLPGDEAKVCIKMRIIIFHSNKGAWESKDRKQAAQTASGGGKEKA